MTEHSKNCELVDRYVRNELSADEEADFETRMLESPELQERVQASLGIKRALAMEDPTEKSASEQQRSIHTGQNSWKTLALAASVLLAVFSTLMLVKTSIESGQLKRQIAVLNQPQTSVLTVPVDIMRSAGGATPDVIIQIPPAGTAVQLDIELTTQSQNQTLLNMALLDQQQNPLITWQAFPLDNGRSTVLIRSEQLSAGLVQLQISDADGVVLEQRLLEFRPPAE